MLFLFPLPLTLDARWLLLLLLLLLKGLRYYHRPSVPQSRTATDAEVRSRPSSRDRIYERAVAPCYSIPAFYSSTIHSFTFVHSIPLIEPSGDGRVLFGILKRMSIPPSYTAVVVRCRSSPYDPALYS